MKRGWMTLGIVLVLLVQYRFGSTTDALKFQSCMTLFAVAAADSGAPPGVYVRALRASPRPYAGLEPMTMEVLRRAPLPSFEQSVQVVDRLLAEETSVGGSGGGGGGGGGGGCGDRGRGRVVPKCGLFRRQEL
mmetsp:Transcript_27607/g.64425  ORF Transcript_27607/g.64425 Transcript_27607/m.64425 type:complete len:133 (-) Transcript_27607:67-465(-)|eukprot:CAMPEP_0119397668 /NCGR_PEP_ID=MMETSP1334-20130426/140452_1 /TAXON_ID=127549 /ORGANISM="Calcidiscus leptoporus, Strain RCC1130" /LENGTH=132 /DNA_ID=CAMNT_0007421513 /DNA_START=1486 /DNA_END=1884 /DNA_ORIENTATION=+